VASRQYLGMMQKKRVYQVPIRGTDGLRQRLVKAWAEKSAERGGLDDAISQWRKRLEVCIHAAGGHFEHLLCHCLPDIEVATQQNRLFSQPSVPRKTTCLFTATNVLRETIYLPSDHKVVQ